MRFLAHFGVGGRGFLRVVLEYGSASGFVSGGAFLWYMVRVRDQEKIKKS